MKSSQGIISIKTATKNAGIILLACMLFSSCQEAEVTTVNNVDEFNEALSSAQPGDIIQLTRGTWKDCELLFEAKGTEDQPIVLRAEKKGEVIIEGESNLRIAGEHLLVEGLVFRNGHTPTGEVISFKKMDGIYANHCRLTECVIDNYNSGERSDQETWVALYGRNNRVDHCYFTDKRNQGVTLVVRLVDSLCQKNHHQIDHNYFGFRQNLGANGGETLRIGTSHYSLTESNTLVSENYFFRCDGEHEIISNKSCGNTYSNNTFFECRGTLTYRHGNDNVSEGNFFFGNGKDHCGGIRIINKRNKAINNYFYGLKGYRFRGALVIMNGVPNSPINRYHQVEGGEFLNNTFINCDHIQLCAGSDEERSMVPVDSRISKNLFYHDHASKIFTVYDDISGITFSDNYIHHTLASLNTDGFSTMDIKLTVNDFGIFRPEDAQLEGIGCSLEKPSASPENTGINWYPVVDKELRFDAGKTIEVPPGLNTLFDAIIASGPGDIVLLEKGGEYKNNKEIRIFHPLTIRSEAREDSPVLKSGKSSLFIIENGGSLKLCNLSFDGRYAPDTDGNSIIRTSRYSMNRNYKLIVENCDIYNLDINHSFDFLRIYNNTFADSVVIRNCNFTNLTGNVMALDKETEERGIYNAEYVRFEGSRFKDIQGAALVLRRGGTDESTFGPDLRISECRFEDVGNGKRNSYGSALYIHGVQITKISDTEFRDSKALRLHLTNGEPVTRLQNCTFYNSGGIISNKNTFDSHSITNNN